MGVSSLRTLTFISIVINIILFTLVILFLFTQKFDLYLFKKTIPYVCERAGKGGIIHNSNSVVRVGDLCLVNDASGQQEEMPIDRKTGAEEEPGQ